MGNTPFWPESASNWAPGVDGVYIFLILVSAVMCILIFGAVGILSVKYRRKPGVQPTPIEGSHLLEITWSVLPMFFFFAFFLWGAIIYFHERTPPQGATEVYVVAKQWMWKIEHPEGQREINTLHVPLGKDVKLIMTSMDVIHSFYIPAFRIKQDVLPGRYSFLWFRATQVGTYHLFCAEYCGTQHSGMIGSIIVQSPSEYQSWLNGGSSNTPRAQTGEKAFAELGCVTCHRSDAQGRGPVLVGIYGKPVSLEDGRTVVADENYVRESILDPGAKIVAGYKPVMPTFQGIISEEQLAALVAYVKSLTPAAGQPAGAVAAKAAPQTSKTGKVQ
jgi:cytochrome c oxidase subunit II